MNFTALAVRSQFRTCATGIRSPWPMSRRRCNAGIRATTISTAAVQEGAGYYQTTMRNGVRSSTAGGYLKQARRRANLKVVSQALATRILFDGRRATGIEYLVGNDKRSASANAEVIVAGGAFNSPQLLQLSGLGPASLLQSHGITVVADAPGVGDDLNDHISGRIMLRCKEPITLNDAVRNWTGKLTHGLHYVLTRRGYLAIPAVSAGCFLRAHPASATPDSQCSISLFSAGTIGGDLHPFPGVTGNCVLLRPESRGYVRIKSADPRRGAGDQSELSGDAKGPRDDRGGCRSDASHLSSARDGALHRRGDRARRSNATTMTTCSISFAVAALPPIIRWAPAAWARIRRPWSTNGCACAASPVCAWSMPRSCRRSFPAIPMRPTIMIGEKGADMILEDAKRGTSTANSGHSLH